MNLAAPVRRLSTLALLLLALAACGGGVASACGQAVNRVDRPLPKFRGSTLDGDAVTLDDYRRGTVVLNIWGAWCSPCRAEAPELARAAKALGPEKVRFLGVDVRDSRTAARAFEEEFSVPYPSVFDEGAALAGKLSTASSPPVTVVARDGRVVAEVFGQTDAETVSCMVRESSRENGH